MIDVSGAWTFVPSRAPGKTMTLVVCTDSLQRPAA